MAVIALTAVILADGPNLTFEDPSALFVNISRLLNRTAYIVLIVVIGASLVDIGKHGYALIKSINP